MSCEENKAIVRKFLEGIGKGSKDAYDEAFSPDLIHHSHIGDKDFNEFRGPWDRGAARKAGSSIEDMIAEDDRVAVWSSTKRGSGEDVHTCFIFRISGGKIIESWNMISIQSQEFGWLPPPKE